MRTTIKVCGLVEGERIVYMDDLETDSDCGMIEAFVKSGVEQVAEFYIDTVMMTL